MIKGIVIFSVTLVFTLLIQLYVVGGWDNQTELSKFLASFVGILLGLVAAIMYLGITKTK